MGWGEVLEQQLIKNIALDLNHLFLSSDLFHKLLNHLKKNVNLDILLIQFSQILIIKKVVAGEYKSCHYKSSQVGKDAVIDCLAPRWISWDCHRVQGEAIPHDFLTFIPTDQRVEPSILRRLKGTLLKNWHGEAAFQEAVMSLGLKL